MHPDNLKSTTEKLQDETGDEEMNGNEDTYDG